MPALYVADDGTVDWLEAYARAGGHLVLGPRTAYADEVARARHVQAPPRLVEAAALHYDEFSDLARPVPVRAVPRGPLPLPGSATATRWAEALTVTDARALMEYVHPHFGRRSAVTTRPHGAGRVTCVARSPAVSWPARPPSGRRRGRAAAGGTSRPP